MTTKKRLINVISQKLNYLPPADVKKAVDLILECLKLNLIKQNRVEIRGLGSFSIRTRAFAQQDKRYNTIYYRMAKDIFEKLN